MILRTYKTEITVNNKQQTLLLQHIGCARWVFNWALAKKKESFDKKEKIPNTIELHRELNKLKQLEVPWMYQSSKTSPQNALRDCDKAFQNFFTRCKKKVKGNAMIGAYFLTNMHNIGEMYKWVLGLESYPLELT